MQLAQSNFIDMQWDMKEETEKKVIRRPILGILSIFLLFLAYRVFTVYTVRSGDCRPKPVDPDQLVSLLRVWLYR